MFTSACSVNSEVKQTSIYSQICFFERFVLFVAGIFYFILVATKGCAVISDVFSHNFGYISDSLAKNIGIQNRGESADKTGLTSQ